MSWARSASLSTFHSPFPAPPSALEVHDPMLQHAPHGYMVKVGHLSIQGVPSTVASCAEPVDVASDAVGRARGRRGVRYGLYELLPFCCQLLFSGRRCISVFCLQLVRMVCDSRLQLRRCRILFCYLCTRGPQQVQEAEVACWCIGGGVIACVRSIMFWHLECSPHKFQLFSQELVQVFSLGTQCTARNSDNILPWSWEWASSAADRCASFSRVFSPAWNSGFCHPRDLSAPQAPQALARRTVAA